MEGEALSRNQPEQLSKQKFKQLYFDFYDQAKKIGIIYQRENKQDTNFALNCLNFFSRLVKSNKISLSLLSSWFVSSYDDCFLPLKGLINSNRNKEIIRIYNKIVNQGFEINGGCDGVLPKYSIKFSLLLKQALNVAETANRKLDQKDTDIDQFELDAPDILVSKFINLLVFTLDKATEPHQDTKEEEEYEDEESDHELTEKEEIILEDLEILQQVKQEYEDFLKDDFEDEEEEKKKPEAGPSTGQTFGKEQIRGVWNMFKDNIGNLIPEEMRNNELLDTDKISGIFDTVVDKIDPSQGMGSISNVLKDPEVVSMMKSFVPEEMNQPPNTGHNLPNTGNLIDMPPQTSTPQTQENSNSQTQENSNSHISNSQTQENSTPRASTE